MIMVEQEIRFNQTLLAVTLDIKFPTLTVTDRDIA